MEESDSKHTVPDLPVYISTSHQAEDNLAWEEYLLTKLKKNRFTLFFYVNHDAVVIGRHQNPWLECRVRWLKTQGITLTRRLSGGGAVFHDLGNLNYSLLSARAFSDRELNQQRMKAALLSLGLPATMNKRGDLLLNRKKISGHAYHFQKEKSVRHGTLLIRCNLERLRNALLPGARDVATHAVASVRSRVANCAAADALLNREGVVAALIKEFELFFRAGARVSRGEPPLEDPIFKALREKYRSWKWVYGQTPNFRVPVVLKSGDGLKRTSLLVNRGIVQEAQPADAFPSLLERPFHELLFEGAVIWPKPVFPVTINQ